MYFKVCFEHVFMLFQVSEHDSGLPVAIKD